MVLNISHVGKRLRMDNHGTHQGCEVSLENNEILRVNLQTFITLFDSENHLQLVLGLIILVPEGLMSAQEIFIQIIARSVKLPWVRRISDGTFMFGASQA